MNIRLRKILGKIFLSSTAFLWFGCDNGSTDDGLSFKYDTSINYDENFFALDSISDCAKTQVDVEEIESQDTVFIENDNGQNRIFFPTQIYYSKDNVKSIGVHINEDTLTVALIEKEKTPNISLDCPVRVYATQINDADLNGKILKIQYTGKLPLVYRKNVLYGSSTECHSEIQCENMDESDISTWAFTVKDSVGNDIKYITDTRYVEKNSWGQGDYTTTETFTVRKDGSRKVRHAMQYSNGDTLWRKEFFEATVSICKEMVENQCCRNPERCIIHEEDALKINCYATFLPLETGDSLKIAECENGQMFLYEPDDIFWRDDKDIPEGVERNFTPKENVGVNCERELSCYDGYDAQGNPFGDCAYTPFCPPKPVIVEKAENKVSNNVLR